MRGKRIARRATIPLPRSGLEINTFAFSYNASRVPTVKWENNQLAVCLWANANGNIVSWR